LDQLLNQLNAAAAEASVATHSPLSVAMALGVAVLLGAFLAVMYNLTYTGKREQRQQISYTIVLLTMGGALVWLLVADSIVRAFGIAGALSVIRYRTRVDDPKDTTLLFFGIILGMACGLHAYSVAVVGAACIAVVLLGIKIVNSVWRIPEEVRVKRNGGGKAAETAPEAAAAELESVESPY
jgi:uncharacterized membrane protein HdeD (DUF308 family)